MIIKNFYLSAQSNKIVSDTLIIIPTYNEKENIKNIILAALKQSDNFSVLVVDDGSPDGTADIVKSLIPDFNTRLFIEERTGKLGLGTAYIHGFKWAIQREYAYIIEMDADFSHPVEKLIELRQTCVNGADFSVGSRYCKGGEVSDWPFGRWLMSYFASVYVRTILWINIKDTTAGFVCWKREVLEEMDLNNIKFIGYAFQIEMKYTATRLGYNYQEVPITFKDRELGTSKMSMGIFKEAIFGVLKMKFKTIRK